MFFYVILFLLKLRQLLLQVMTTMVKTVPITTPAGVQKTASTLTEIFQRGSELSTSALVLQRLYACARHNL